MTADNLNNMRVIPDLLAINEKVRPNKVAYRQFDDKSKTWISVTWKEFADMVRSWRKAFTASGLSKGDHAAVLLPNSITATACDLSILSQGMVPVPLHAVDTPSSSAFILNNSEAKILLLSSKKLMSTHYWVMSSTCQGSRKQHFSQTRTTKGR